MDEEWHKLVPETAREALGQQEVARQSNIFELFKAEREYVSDLEAVLDVCHDSSDVQIRLSHIFQVFVEPLRTGDIIKGDGKPEDFIHEVFWNLHEVLTFHQRMLAALFARQREQHPLIQSIADIVLESTPLRCTSS